MTLMRFQRTSTVVVLALFVFASGLLGNATWAQDESTGESSAQDSNQTGSDQAEQAGEPVHYAQPRPGTEIPLEEKDLDTTEKLLAEIERLGEVEREHQIAVTTGKRRPTQFTENSPLAQLLTLQRRLLDSEPAHPSIVPMFDERWRMFVTRMKSSSRVRGESLVALRKTEPGSELHQLARFWFTWSQIRELSKGRGSRPEQMLDAIDEFKSEYPVADRVSELLWVAHFSSRRHPEFRVQLLRRLVDEYPSTKYGRIAAGRLRQTEGIGKPVEFEFEDVRGGEKITNDQFEDRILVIYFGSVRNGSLASEVLKTRNTVKKYRDRGVRGLLYSLDPPEEYGGKAKLLTFLEENDFDWPVVYTGDAFEDEFLIDWGITDMAQRFVIDRDGHLYSTNPDLFLNRMIENLLESESENVENDGG